MHLLRSCYRRIFDVIGKYDTLLSGNETVLQIVCTIWEKYIHLNVAWILDILSLFVVTNRNMHVRGLSGNLAFSESYGWTEG